MKYLVLVTFLVLCWACNLKSTKNQNATERTPNQEKTSVSFTENAHNFGKLTAGEIVVHTFVFTNTGKNNYQIEKVVADCACINTRYEQKVIKPGEKGTIEVEFNTAGTAGREYKTIEVYGNSEELKHLAIFAEVKNEIISF